VQIVITPESESRKRNRWIVNELVKLHKQYLDGRLPVYDGRKGLFTAGPLPFKAKEFVLKLTNPDRANQGYGVLICFSSSCACLFFICAYLRCINPCLAAACSEKEYRVTIKDAAKLDMYNLKQFLAGRQRELPQDTIQALDIAMRERPNEKY
jgi:eukaryotic translation initiation factor 2C